MTVTTLPVLSLFDDLLLQADGGRPAPLTMHDPLGGTHLMDAAGWCRRELPGDAALLARCVGPTLDVGCGPGRLTSALNRSGVAALGIDISATAVRLARARGAAAVRRDVFSSVPDEGRWQSLLLADGNIGIGGDPLRLLRRCRELLHPDGRVQAELAAPGVVSWSGEAQISTASGAISAPFGWAVVAADAISPLAGASGLEVVEVRQKAQRWFATLAPV